MDGKVNFEFWKFFEIFGEVKIKKLIKILENELIEVRRQSGWVILYSFTSENITPFQLISFLSVNEWRFMRNQSLIKLQDSITTNGSSP